MSVLRFRKLLYALAALIGIGNAEAQVSEKEYYEKAKHIWQTHVPDRGQAETVQGELLRAVEKLADEAQRNGNINWDEGHEILVGYLRSHLSDSDVFSKNQISRLAKDLDRIMDFDSPYTDDDLYNRLRNRVVDWHLANPNGKPHIYNPDLHR